MATVAADFVVRTGEANDFWTFEKQLRMSEQFVKLHTWMTELDLSGSELIAFAVIHHYAAYQEESEEEKRMRSPNDKLYDIKYFEQLYDEQNAARGGTD